MSEIINDFKDKYDIKSTKELGLKLSIDNEAELSGCIYLINQIVKNYEYYISQGNNPKDVERLFYIEYKKIINDFMELYFNELIKDLYDMSISTVLKKQLTDKINSEYNLEKCNLKEIIKILNKEFTKAMNIKVDKEINPINVNREKNIVKIEDYKNNKKIKNDDELSELRDYIKDRYNNVIINFSQYANYNKFKEEISKDIKISKTRCKNMLNNKLVDNIDELYKSINHEINSLCNVIEMFLEKQLEMDNCAFYIKKLKKEGYLNENEKDYYLKKLNKANNIYYIYNLNNELYNNHYYPIKVKRVKDTLNKHFNHWMMRKPGEKYVLRDYKNQIFEMLDNNYVSKDVLEKLENMGIMGINGLMDDITRNTKRKR